jgi:hypothetical protein
MIDNASVVVSQPLPVVEAMIREVTSWPGLFGEVEEVAGLARDRYAVQLRRGRRTRTALVRVRRNAADHRLAWQALSGPNWAGEVHLVALTGRRTAVHLTFDRSPRQPAHRPGPGEGLRRLLRGLIPVLSRRGGSRRPVSQARRDLARFRERVDAVPRPVRPARMGPLPGARPVEDVLIIDGIRHGPQPAPVPATVQTPGSTPQPVTVPTPGSTRVPRPRPVPQMKAAPHAHVPARAKVSETDVVRPG